MPGGDEAAIFKGVADGADKALGDAGDTLGGFAEKTAQTADDATDRVLSTEEGNTKAFAGHQAGGPKHVGPVRQPRVAEQDLQHPGTQGRRRGRRGRLGR